VSEGVLSLHHVVHSPAAAKCVTCGFTCEKKIKSICEITSVYHGILTDGLETQRGNLVLLKALQWEDWEWRPLICGSIISCIETKSPKPLCTYLMTARFIGVYCTFYAVYEKNSVFFCLWFCMWGEWSKGAAVIAICVYRWITVTWVSDSILIMETHLKQLA